LNAAQTFEFSPPALQRRRFLADVPDTLARIFVAALFVLFSIRLGNSFLETLRPTTLLLLCSESLIVVLMIVRRSAIVVDRVWKTRAVTALSIVGPYLVQPDGNGLPDIYTSPLLAGGLLLVIGGKVSLGRSFGIMPANRGVVRAGAYRVVRHPIYTGYLITHVAFAFGNPTAWNLATLFAADLALTIRALYEERVLRHDPRYVDYCALVRWRLLPGLF